MFSPHLYIVHGTSFFGPVKQVLRYLFRGFRTQFFYFLSTADEVSLTRTEFVY